MTEFSAFIFGLIVGESLPSGQTKSVSSAKPIHNTALQDVVFCQCLRNVVDEMDEYVKTAHPTPEEFIRHLLPEDSFEPPYTREETETIERNQRDIKRYADWIKEKVRSKSLIGGRTWNDLDAIRMIWQDEVHTPEFEHLDLLFGHCLLSKPIKKNGRLYEYGTYKNNAPLDGLAKGFFVSVPAQIILRLCLECTQEIMKKYGYHFDFQRFEYNQRADNNGTLDEWKQEQRQAAYKMLLKDMPSFCRSTWSDYTVALKDIHNYRSSEQVALSKEEAKRRQIEAGRVCSVLTADERKSFSVDTVKTNPFLIAIAVVFLITIVIIIVGIIVGIAVSDDAENTVVTVMVILGSINIFILVFLAIFAYVPSKKNGGVSRKVFDYVVVLQSAYYSASESESAKKYGELLERANNSSSSN